MKLKYVSAILIILCLSSGLMLWVITYPFSSGNKYIDQYKNSGDIRCAVQELYWCGEYNRQAKQGTIVEECEDINIIDDFCYEKTGMVTPTQIRLTYRQNHNATYTCNCNSDPYWCNYCVYPCTPFNLGYFDEIFCKPYENMTDCADRSGVDLCIKGNKNDNLVVIKKHNVGYIALIYKRLINHIKGIDNSPKWINGYCTMTNFRNATLQVTPTKEECESTRRDFGWTITEQYYLDCIEESKKGEEWVFYEDFYYDVECTPARIVWRESI